MNEHRKNIFSRLQGDGWKIASYIDPQANVRTSDLGIGNIILDGANIGVKSKIGDGNIFYPNSLLAHHSTIGSFNFFAINSSVAGNVKIGDCCFFGNNSCTRDNIIIADYTLLGAGAYINHDITDVGQVYVPAHSQLLDKNSKKFL